MVNEALCDYKKKKKTGKIKKPRNVVKVTLNSHFFGLTYSPVSYSFRDPFVLFDGFLLAA